MEMIYTPAKRAEDLLWHCETPPTLLVRAVQQRNKPGKALDLGCGGGTNSAYLARQGYEVTALDFVPKAIEFARARAHEEALKIGFVVTDLLRWKAEHQFDVILDSGTLHTIPQRQLPRYKAQLLSWLAPAGDYILCHWGKRHPLDWHPFVPKRRKRRDLITLFSPPLREQAYEEEIGTNFPFPIGPKVLWQRFWFQRDGANLPAK
jgi:SAM-dependent methyltransferase